MLVSISLTGRFKDKTYIVTTIANRPVASVAAGSQEGHGHLGEGGLARSWCEAVVRVVTVLHSNVARHTKVVVVAYLACDELGLVKDYLNQQPVITIGDL